MKNKLPGDYIAGLVDGEGCFALNFRRDIRRERRGSPTYFYWKPLFAIVLRSDDRNILEGVKSTLGCGSVYIDGRREAVRYQVSKLNELLDVIIPFFDKYKLHAKKGSDFELWKESLQILNRNKQSGTKFGEKIKWDVRDANRLLEITKAMKNYKSRGKDWLWSKELTRRVV